MKQVAIAKECAKWLEEKAEIKSLRNLNPAQTRVCIYMRERFRSIFPAKTFINSLSQN